MKATKTKEIKKITAGYVVQVFGSKGKLVSQEFIANDDSEYEDDMGNALDEVDCADLYHPFLMEQ